jgi:hypothetical protein
MELRANGALAPLAVLKVLGDDVCEGADEDGRIVERLGSVHFHTTLKKTRLRRRDAKR